MPRIESYDGPESYSKYGFAIIRNVLSAQEVREIRALLDTLFIRGPFANRPMFFLDTFFKYPALYKCIFRKRVTEGLKHCLGDDLVFISDFVVHHNAYGLPGWHVDCGSESGNAYLYDKHYKFAKCGIFLQDYDNGWGGSIYVKPSSHRAYFTSKKFLRYFLKALTLLQVKFNINTFLVEARAGDLVFFDSRLYHQSSEPSPENRKNFKQLDAGYWSVPPEHTKYVIYWDSCSAKMVGDHLQNSMKRSNTEQTNPQSRAGKEAVYTRNLSYYYPDDYPAEVIQSVRELGIQISSLAKGDCDQYKKRLAMFSGPSDS